MKEEGRHAPKLERRERGTSGQDLEHTCHNKAVGQVPGGKQVWVTEG
jgi:hypothetical protein